MNTNKLTICLLALPLALTTLACPTRIKPSSEEDGGAGTGGAISASGGAAGSATAGRGGGAGAVSEKGTGGMTGTGGVVSTGGVQGTGGATSMGGMTGAGGITSTGGVPGTGGAASTGGATGTGGMTGTGGTPVTCNPACSATQSCVGAQCLLVDGQTCSLASQCASKDCTPFYVDGDGDGYGAGAATGFCGTTAPIGYSTKNGDCCDDANHLAIAQLIHPGAGFQTSSAGGVCGVTWDFDCSGIVEKSYKGPQCSFPTPPCVTDNGQADYPDSECGTNTAACSCDQSETAQTCSIVCHGPGGILGCK